MYRLILWESSFNSSKANFVPWLILKRYPIKSYWKKNDSDTSNECAFFGKVDSPCCCIWALHKTTPDIVITIIDRPEEAISNNLYIQDYLDSFHTMEVAMGVWKDINRCADEKRILPNKTDFYRPTYPRQITISRTISNICYLRFWQLTQGESIRNSVESKQRHTLNIK